MVFALNVTSPSNESNFCLPCTPPSRPRPNFYTPVSWRPLYEWKIPVRFQRLPLSGSSHFQRLAVQPIISVPSFFNTRYFTAISFWLSFLSIQFPPEAIGALSCSSLQSYAFGLIPHFRPRLILCFRAIWYCPIRKIFLEDIIVPGHFGFRAQSLCGRDDIPVTQTILNQRVRFLCPLANNIFHIEIWIITFVRTLVLLEKNNRGYPYLLDLREHSVPLNWRTGSSCSRWCNCCRQWPPLWI